MKKSIYIMGISFMMLLVMLVYTGCSCVLGTCTIMFESWGGVTPSTITLTPGASIISNTLPSSVSKACYKFLHWCYDDELTRPLEFPMVAGRGVFTYYAKYELDMEHISQYITVLDWTSDKDYVETTATISTPFSYMHFFVNKTDITHEFDSVVITPINAVVGQEFKVASMYVFDENGATLLDSDGSSATFKPVGDKSSNSFKYIIRVNADFRAGDFRITIS